MCMNIERREREREREARKAQNRIELAPELAPNRITIGGKVTLVHHYHPSPIGRLQPIVSDIFNVN